MSLELESFLPHHADEARRFNRRLERGGWRSFGLPVTPESEPPGDPREDVWRERHVMVDPRGHIRGGLLLQRQPLRVAGELEAGANLQSPIAEGIVDRKFAAVGATMLKRLTRKVPLVFAVGMGGMEQPLPRLLDALGWTVREVPFLFRVHRPANFVRGLPLLRSTPLRRFAAELAGRTGVARLALPPYFRPARGAAPLDAGRLEAWGAWADALWERAAPTYGFAGVRTARTLARLHPPESRVLLYRFERDAEIVGWLALLDTRMSGSPHFGDLRVGTILDGVALEDRIADVVAAGDRILAERGVDLCVSNQAHPGWIEALRGAGFRPGRSNYLFAASPALSERLPSGPRGPLHVNRGDGDGRIHL